MLVYLKKTWKLTLYAILCIHLLGCNAHQVKMGRGKPSKPSNKSVQRAERPAIPTHDMPTGHEYDTMSLKYSSQKQLKACVKQGMLNVNKLVKRHPDFQYYFTEEELIKAGLATPNKNKTNNNRLKLAISEKNKNRALAFISTSNTQRNSVVKKVITFIEESYKILDSIPYIRSPFTHWRSYYTDAIEALNIGPSGANSIITPTN